MFASTLLLLIPALAGCGKVYLPPPILTHLPFAQDRLSEIVPVNGIDVCGPDEFDAADIACMQPLTDMPAGHIPAGDLLVYPSEAKRLELRSQTRQGTSQPLVEIDLSALADELLHSTDGYRVAIPLDDVLTSYPACGTSYEVVGLDGTDQIVASLTLSC